MGELPLIYNDHIIFTANERCSCGEFNQLTLGLFLSPTRKMLTHFCAKELILQSTVSPTMHSYLEGEWVLECSTAIGYQQIPQKC